MKSTRKPTSEQIAQLNQDCDRWIAEEKSRGTKFFKIDSILASLYSKYDLGIATENDLAEIERLEDGAIERENE
jgi:hypothetical protein